MQAGDLLRLLCAGWGVPKASLCRLGRYWGCVWRLGRRWGFSARTGHHRGFVCRVYRWKQLRVGVSLNAEALRGLQVGCSVDVLKEVAVVQETALEGQDTMRVCVEIEDQKGMR